MLSWENEAGLEIAPESWTDMVSNMRKCTKPMAVRETVLKLHTRYTPSRLNKFSPLITGELLQGLPR